MSQAKANPERRSGSFQSLGGVSRETVFEVLSNQRRRYTLHYLKQLRDSEADLGRLAEQVAAWENAKRIERLTSAERKRVKTALQQFHLPKMDESNLLDYDSRRGTISLSEVGENIEVYIDIVSKRDIPWGPYYLSLTAINVLLLFASWSNLYPFRLLPNLAWVGFFIVSLSISALVHTYYTYSEMQLGGRKKPLEVENS